MSTVTPSAVVSRSELGPIHRSERRLWMWLFVLMAAIFLVFQEGAITGYDGGTMYEVTRSIVEDGDVAIAEEWNTLPGRDQLEYGRYGLGLSLVAAVPYALTRPFAVASGNPERLLEGVVASAMPLIAAALVVALYALARRMGGGVGGALFVGIGAVVGTFVLPYTKEFFAEPLMALFLVVAVERSLADRHVASGLALGAALLTRAQFALLAPVFVLVAWRRRGLRGASHTVAGIAPGLVLTLLYNFVRFEHPLRFGYEDVGFTTPLWEGTGGLLVNPLKSVLLFAPIVVLLPLALAHLWRRDRSAFVLLTTNLGAAFILTATWFAWHGGWSWGPRLLLPALVPAIAAVAPWLSTHRHRRAAVFLFAGGFAISMSAWIVSTQAQQLEVPLVPPETHFLDTQPLSSPSVKRQFELIAPTTRYSVEHLYEGSPDGKNYLRYLSLWQLGAAREFGRMGLAMAAAGTLLLCVLAGAAAWKLHKAVRDRSGLDLSRAGPEPIVSEGGAGV